MGRSFKLYVLLLKKGADIHARCTKVNTPFSRALMATPVYVCFSLKMVPTLALKMVIKFIHAQDDQKDYFAWLWQKKSIVG